MKRVLRAVLVCAALVAALAFAACGNEDENEYVDEVNAVQQSFLDEVTAAASTPPTNPQQAGELVSTMQDAFTNAAEEFEAIEPPEDVADLHDQLVTTMADLGAQIGDLGEALQSGNPQQAATAATELQASITESQTEVTGLIDQINSQLQE